VQLAMHDDVSDLRNVDPVQDVQFVEFEQVLQFGIATEHKIQDLLTKLVVFV